MNDFRGGGLLVRNLEPLSGIAVEAVGRAVHLCAVNAMQAAVKTSSDA